MYISTLRNIKWGVEGLLVRWTGPPSPGGPWHQKVGKKNKLAMHIAIYTINTVAHFGSRLRCRSSAKSTSFIIA